MSGRYSEPRLVWCYEKTVMSILISAVLSSHQYPTMHTSSLTFVTKCTCISANAMVQVRLN